MECLSIQGGRPLAGCVAAGGAKNAALPIMAAALLATGPVQLAGVPKVRDVATLSELLQGMGMEVHWQANGQLWLQTLDERNTSVPRGPVRRMRAGFCVLGPLLARRGRARIALPGGCRLGPRPVDLHLAALAAMGAKIELRGETVCCSARRLVGARVNLSGPRGPSVTGTANLLCAAATARGTTILEGAAREPEVVDLGRFLVRLGADVEGLGTPTIMVRGVELLGGGRYTIIPDRIEAATLLLAGAISGGMVSISNVVPEQLEGVLALLEQTAGAVRVSDNAITLAAYDRPRRGTFTARPFPGLPTDLQAPWMALVSVAEGSSLVRDEVFPERFAHVRPLQRLGARIVRAEGAAKIEGVARLSGARATAPDLRAAAALVLAGLAAEGETLVAGLAHLDRGYERLDEKLRQLGAGIVRTGGEGTMAAGDRPCKRRSILA